jgi:UDP-glucose 4-epimerase
VGRRVLITGLGTFWGGRTAQALEADPDVDVIIGLDKTEPTIELERTEFVRTDENYSILSRIVRATGVDTVVHTFLVVDSTQMTSTQLHEINVIGTMNLFAAASAEGSTVEQVVVKSSSLVYGAGPRDPYWFRESTRRVEPVRTRIERSLLEVEGYVRDFALDNPHVAVSLLRFSNVIGPDLSTPLIRALQLPLVPAVFGFDPRFQFLHEDDVVRALRFAFDTRLAGVFNVAGDGLLPWSEVVAMCGKRRSYLPFVGTTQFAAMLRRVGIELPPETVALLRNGRGVDNRLLKAAGFEYSYTSAGAVEAFVKASRLRSTVGNIEPEYHYDQDLETFFQHSPAVLRDQ